MSALLAPPDASEVRFETLTPDWLDAVMPVELAAYASPWSRTNFVDALVAGYQMQILLADDTVLGYFVAMQGVDEVHLLNITVAPAYQGQGWSHLMLDALALWSRGQKAQWLWLEARVGNTRALHVYNRYGFNRVGMRKDYYPNGPGQREHAIVMSMPL
ncbi:MAG: ribosomal protein S18-alanine N-acetyltransferase [Rhodoferax sp.]|uniref:ribosomal protein S18-alanine N-acetyltransferase n=1 Tax=Rhodoferax sp. TaxID=50421 RepID=UPI003262DB2F